LRTLVDIFETVGP